MKYPLAAPDAIPQADLDALAEWLKTGPWLTMGKLVTRFEEEFAQWLGVKHAVMVNSGSSANLLMWAAVKHLKKPPSVTAPAVAWSTTISPAMQLGLSVELQDVDEATWGVKEKQVHGIAVHVLGVPCASWGHLLEDACAALGSEQDGKKVGTTSWLSSFSFFWNHQASTIEGGMVCTYDDGVADVIRILRAHGWANDLTPEREAVWWKRHHRGLYDFQRRFAFYLPGFNVRPTELQAFLGLRQLSRLAEHSAARADIDARYRKNLGGQPHISIQTPRLGDRVASIAVGVLATSVEHRAKIAYALEQAGVETRPVGGGNMARQPFWQAIHGPGAAEFFGERKYPVADAIHERGFQLPNGPHLTEADVDFIADTVLKVRP